MPPLFVANKAVLVDPQGKILTLRHADGNFDLPGGRMEQGEAVRDAFNREIREEVGLDISRLEAKLFHVHEWYVGNDPEKGKIVALFYIVKLKTHPEIQLSNEHGSMAWIDPRTMFPIDDRYGKMESPLSAYMAQECIVPLDERIKGRQGYGLIQLIHGTGKGKTTAALGQAIRCAGAGKRVKIVYFDKGGTTHYSERKIIEQVPNITYVATGRDRIDPVTNKFDFSITDVDRAEARRGLEEASHALTSGEYDLVVLDEINSTVDLGMLAEADVLEVLKNKKETVEVILTGRNPPQSFIDAAHLVTEMKLERHYFYSGVQAREGLDF